MGQTSGPSAPHSSWLCSTAMMMSRKWLRPLRMDTSSGSLEEERSV